MSHLENVDSELQLLKKDEQLKVMALGAHQDSSSATDQRILNPKGEIALTLGELGRYEETVSIQREVLEIYTRVWGYKHPHTITTKTNLAHTLLHIGKFQEAELLQIQVVALRQETLGAKHLNAILAMGISARSGTHLEN